MATDKHASLNGEIAQPENEFTALEELPGPGYEFCAERPDVPEEEEEAPKDDKGLRKLLISALGVTALGTAALMPVAASTDAELLVEYGTWEAEASSVTFLEDGSGCFISDSGNVLLTWTENEDGRVEYRIEAAESDAGAIAAIPSAPPAEGTVSLDSKRLTICLNGGPGQTRTEYRASGTD